MGPCEEQAGLRERSKQPVMVLLAECLDLHLSGLRSSAHSREWRGALSPSRSSNCHPPSAPTLRPKRSYSDGSSYLCSCLTSSLDMSCGVSFPHDSQCVCCVCRGDGGGSGCEGGWRSGAW